MANVFDLVAHKLRTRGWIKGSFGNDMDGYCVMGALSACFATGAIGLFPQAVDTALWRATRLVTDGRLSDPIEFNDEPDTTIEDINLMLKYASELWDAENLQTAAGPSSG